MEFVTRVKRVIRWKTSSDHSIASVIDYSDPSPNPEPRKLTAEDALPTGRPGVYRLVVADLNGRDLTVEVYEQTSSGDVPIHTMTSPRTVLLTYRVIPNAG